MVRGMGLPPSSDDLSLSAPENSALESNATGHLTIIPTQAQASQTIRPAAPAGLDDPMFADALATRATPLAREIELRGTLGEGGMGVVRLGRQVLLGREVAVKAALPRAGEARPGRLLMQEAWASAALEHPNIVPVYLLVADESGHPNVVMRRIEGPTWADLIGQPERVRERFGARDLLAWHLGVLMQVCNAIHFAHSRGILHRDLKPENVMVGGFGEVYVLDWGLAARVRADGPPYLPHVRDLRKAVGTPRFMAPEMARADGAAISERTDVYLLGAMLYAVLTGHGPHPGETVAETLANIPAFRPVLPPQVPPRLVEILTRAMATDPAERPSSAEALRLELQAFLEERSVDGLVDEALARLGSLLGAIDADLPDRPHIYREYEAARFGFRSALRVLPGHEGAADGLRSAVLAVIGYELSSGEGRAAALLLGELADPPSELVTRVRDAESMQAAAAADLARLRANVDPVLGGRTRIFVFSLVMVLWSAIPLGAWLAGVEPTHSRLLVSHGSMLAIGAPLVLWARDSLGRTELNRRVAQMLLVVQVSLVIGDLVGLAAGMSATQVLLFNQLLFVVVSALLALDQPRIARLPALGYLASLFLSVWRPSLALPTIGLANLLVVGVIFGMWYPAMRGRLLREPTEVRAG